MHLFFHFLKMGTHCAYYLIIVLVTLFIPFLIARPRNGNNRDSEVWSKDELNKHPLICEACLAAMGEVYKYATSNKTEECLKKFTVKLCETLQWQDDDVCQGIVNEYGDSVLYIIDTMLFDPNRVCSQLYEGCGGQPPFKPGTYWRVSMTNTTKPERQKPVLPSPDKPKLRVLHLADLHFDKYYVEGSEANCSEPYCCRKPSNGTVTEPAGKWGTTGRCDLPIRTLENMFQYLASRDDFDYVIWTGDASSHDVWEITKEYQIDTLTTLFDLFEEYFPDKLIISAAGNHEGVPPDMFPPHNFNIPEEFRSDWLYEIFADNWTKFGIGTDPEIYNSILNTATYVTRPYPGLRVISLNTIYCYPSNYWLALNEYDPDNVLSWLIKQLQDAEDDGEKVHIIGHIPPGDTCLKEWSANFYDIVNRYENTITGLFYGHTHDDSFEMFYENGNISDPIQVGYVAPSGTPIYGNWPAFRIYTIDGNYPGSSYRVLEHETYMLNLDEANAHDNVTWVLEYKAQEAYGMNSLLPEDWNDLINRFVMDDDLFQQYYRYHGRAPRPPCYDTCKSENLCSLRTGRSKDPDLCKDLAHQDSLTEKSNENKELDETYDLFVKVIQRKFTLDLDCSE